MSRPEHVTAPETYYDATEAVKYTQSSRIIRIQAQMAERAIELLAIPDDDTPRCLLDIGCGSGLSGSSITDAGHWWVGVDISEDMLKVATSRGVGGDMLLNDMGQGFGFRPGMFDGCISVSALQWLCYSTKKGDIAHQRVVRFFHNLYRALKRGARAALQLYPETPEQLEMILAAAASCGFSGGTVIDFPNSTKAKKVFLVMTAGADGTVPAAKLGDEAAAGAGAGAGAGSSAAFERRHGKKGRGKLAARKAGYKKRDWVLLKKEQQRKKGLKVRRDTKFTGRKRKDKF